MRTVRSTVTVVSLTLSVIAMIGLAPSVASAQDAGRGDVAPTVALEEIVVVARRREEKLQDVPISVSAFSAQAIRDRNIQDSYDLANFTPNFNFTQNLGRRLDVPNIRGQFGPLNASTPPNASFFVDGVFVTGSIATTSLANLERAEILRGPQSALLGRATFSGAINYITRKPTDEYEGAVNARYGEDGDTELGAWVSGPIPAGESVFKDTLYFFAGASWNEWDGQWNNGLEPGQVNSTTLFPSFGPTVWSPNTPFPGDPPCPAGSLDGGCAYTVGDNTELGAEQTKIGTLKLTYRPLESLEFNFKAEFVDGEDGHYAYRFVPPAQNNNCYNRDNMGNDLDNNPAHQTGSRSGGWICGAIEDSGFVPVVNIPHLVRGVMTTLDFFRLEPPMVAPPAPFLGMEEEIQRYLAQVDYDFRDYSFILRYAHNRQDSEFVRDLDRSYALGPVSTGLFESNSFFSNEDNSWEFRVQSPGDQRVRWQLGYYYYNFNEDRFQRDFTGFSRFVMSDTGKQEVTNDAVFGGIEIDIVDNWRVALEGRYAEDEITRLSGPFDDPVTMEETRSEANETFYSFSPRFTLSWFVNPTLTTYFQVAEGNKPGGFNFAYFDVGVDPIELDSDKPFIDEEEATTWEIGAKGSFFDGKLSANVAAFYIDWTNQAINTSVCIQELPMPAGSGTCEQNSIVVNAGESQVYGAEVELAWVPIDRLSLTLGYGYADTELEQFIDEEFAALQCPELCYQEDSVTGQPTQAALDEVSRLGDVAGNEAPRVPKHNVAASAVWQAPISGELEWFLRNDFIYESKRYNTTSNLTWAPSQFTWNARLGLESEKWSVSLYVDNLTDEDSALQIQDFPLFDDAEGYNVPPTPPAMPGDPLIPAGAISQNAFSILPRRTRNAGVTAQFRFGS